MKNYYLESQVQCPPLNWITLGQHKSDNNNRMIQLTNVFYVMLWYNGTSNIWLQYAADSIICDPIKRRPLYKKKKVFWKTTIVKLQLMKTSEIVATCLESILSTFYTRIFVECALRSFSLYTDWLCNFLAKESRKRSPSYNVDVINTCSFVLTLYHIKQGSQIRPCDTGKFPLRP